MKLKLANPSAGNQYLFIKQLTLCALLASTSAFSAVSDDPLLTAITIDELELRHGDGEKSFNWDLQTWTGYDLKKFVIKAKGSRANGEIEDSEIQFLYSKAIAPYWDLQFGIRHDIKPSPNQTWAVVGVQGLAPYFFETDISFYLSEEGNTALRLASEYEFMLSQRLVLTPSISADIYAKDDAERGIGKGLSEIEVGLRLKYEVTREFAPYIGVNYERSFGKTASLADAANESSKTLQFVAGIQFRF
ncbi:copper resistance protein B [Moritella sp.]|uniref:copper resistance protein B n=1 Tax=Moritella sp. TaxID=78556 RepID=UPI0025DC050A|nr:copper resistance protein B [Moritella sp.]